MKTLDARSMFATYALMFILIVVVSAIGTVSAQESPQPRALEPVEVEPPERRPAAARSTSSEGGFGYDQSIPSGQAFSDFPLTASELVSATGRVANLATVPAAVSIVENKGIAAQGRTGVVDFVRALPGIWSAGYNGNMFMAPIAMRGFSLMPSGMNRTAILLDGRNMEIVRSMSNTSLAFPELIERVEVMRGDGTIQFGNKAIGGSVNIIMKKPRQNPGVYFGAEGSSWHGQREWGAINLVRGPLAAGVFFGQYLEEGFRLYEGDGQTEEFIPRPGPWELYNFSGSVNWKITPRLSLDVSHLSSKQRMSNSDAVELERWERRDTRNVSKDRVDGGADEEWDAVTIMKLGYDGGRLGALDITGSRRCYDINNHSYLFASFGRRTFFSRWTDYGLSFKYTRTDEYSFLRNDLTIGSDWYDGKYGQECKIIDGDGSSSDRYRLEHRNETSTYRETMSYHVMNQTRLWDRFIFGLGYRIEDYEFRDLYYEQAGVIRAVQRFGQPKSASQYSLNVIYDKELGSSVYYKHSRTYRFPVVNEIVNTGISSYSHPDPIFYVDPEEGTLEEVGIRHWFTPNIYASLIYYELDMDNEIMSEWDLSLPTPRSWTTNVPDVSHDGLEFEGMIKLTPRWTLTGNLTHQKVIYRSSNLRASYQPPGRMADKWVPGNAALMYHVNLAYENQDWGFSTMFSYHYCGKRYFQGDDTNQDMDVDEIKTGDLAVSQKFFEDTTSVYFGIKNISDLQYAFNTYYFFSGGNPVYRWWPEAGRTYYMGVKTTLDYDRMRVPTTNDLRRMQRRLYGSLNEGVNTFTGMGSWIRNSLPWLSRAD